MNLCTAEAQDIRFVLDLYLEAFPENERKPFSLIERKAAMGTMEILVLREGKKRVGLAITATEGDLVLLDYFAVSGEVRGGGYGTEALLLLKELYRDRLLFLEIERTDVPAENADERQRRKSFYLRNGMLDTGIRIELFGVGMELLASGEGLTFARSEKLYRSLMGPTYRDMVRETGAAVTE